MAKPKTIKATITIAVDEQGNWSAAGWSKKGGAISKTVAGEHRDVAVEGLPMSTHYQVVEVEVAIPLPFVPKVTGAKVVKTGAVVPPVTS